jgi:hypothetical protein
MMSSRRFSGFPPFFLFLAAVPHLLDAQTTVMLTTSPNPSIFGAPVVLTAAVTPSTATGRVTFYDGVTILGTAPLVSGSASISTILLPAVGSRKLKAYYAGDDSNTQATSNVAIQKVNAIAVGSFAAGTPPSHTANFLTFLADVNGDGKADIVGGDPPAVLLGDGRGNFQPSYFPPDKVWAVGDFNGDGKTDLVIVTGTVLRILLGNGDGTFQAPINTTIEATGGDVAVGDFNGDGKADLANTLFGILLGNGDGTFRKMPRFGGGTVIVTGDFNGDGIADLATSDGSNNVMILPGNGDGTFRPAIESAVPGPPTRMATGDFNGDGKPDLATVCDGNLIVLLGEGDGTFQSPVTFAPGAVATYSGYFVAVGDFNGDGIADLLVDSKDFIHNILLGNGDGTFQPPVTFLGNIDDSVLIADFNGDGRPDLFFSDGYLGSLLFGAPVNIQVAGGTPQSTTIRTAFAAPLQVIVQNNGLPVSGAAVVFRAPASGPGAFLSGITAITGASGVASVTATANNAPGSYTVTASYQIGTVSFSLTNFAGPPVSITASGGSPQSTPIGTAFGNALQATVKDSAGNPVPGVTVFFAMLTAGPSAAGAVLSSAAAVTNASGVASVTATANNTPGSYTVTASVGGLSAAFSLTNVAGGGASNLALGKPAEQSSTFPGYLTDGAAAAVDGNTDGNFFDGSVTATNLDPNPWWQVDLGSSAAVSSIVIWNRTDCCGSRLNDYWVFVSDVPFGPTDTPLTLQNRAGTFSSHQSAAPNPSATIAAGAQGRYVRVQLTGANYLSLAEVQVFGTSPAPPPPTNLAQGKLAVQSSTFPGYATDGAAAAVDGNTDGNFFDGSVTATNTDPNAWWQVDLGASAAVRSIVIWNRTDCCGSRLNDYWVFISDTPFSPTDTPLALQNRAGTFSSHQTTTPNPSAVIAAGAQGRYVRVQLTGTNYLSLAEVQVLQ